MVRITGVAVLDGEGRLWSLPAPKRHFHIFALAAFLSDTADGQSSQQGFTTNEGRFVGRSEAVAIVEANGQALPGRAIRGGKVFSEDLW